MSLRIYNTLSRALEPFTPLEPGHVRMYVCGMTVYDLCHLGHARAMVAFDVVQRWLKASGLRVTYAEPVVADGGELIIYGPHIHEVSITHGHLIKQVGYHTRDYFLAQMDKFRHIPGGVLAHSTHVRGIGTYDDGGEHCRVQVTLATSIPEEECKAINLGYRDWRTVNPEDWRDKEDEGLLLVPRAGEVLYRLKENNPRPRALKAEAAERT